MMCEELKDHLIFISMHSDIDRPKLLRRLSLQLLGARFDISVQQYPSEAKYVSHHLVAREKDESPPGGKSAGDCECTDQPNLHLNKW